MLEINQNKPQMKPREPIQLPQPRSYATHRTSADPLLCLDEKAGGDTPSLSSTSDDVSAEESCRDSPQLEDLRTLFSTLSRTITVDEWIKENGIIYGEADSPEHGLSKGKRQEQPLGQSTKENRGTDGPEVRDAKSQIKYAHQQPCSNRGAAGVHTAVPSIAPFEVLLRPEKVQIERMQTSDVEEEAGRRTAETGATQEPDQSASGETQENTPKHNTSTDEDIDTPWTPEDYRKLNYAIRKLKKQLDPLNYSDFGFTVAHGASMLAFSNSVRKCILTSGTFGHETERLNRFLNVMMMEAADGPHRLELQLIKHAHLDKLVEEVVQFKSRPPALPFEQLQMIEMASDLLRYWRNRFSDSYFTLDKPRQKVVMEQMLWGLTYVSPTVQTPSGWMPLADRSLMSERDAENAFSEGQ